MNWNNKVRVVFTFTALLLIILHALSAAHALSIDEFLGEGEVSSSSEQANTIVSNSNSAIGGTRSLYAMKSGSGAGMTRVETFADPEFVGDTDFSFGYTQGAHTGRGIVTWDGDQNSSGVIPNGLGSIDLTQDFGSAIQIGIKFYDFPSGQPIDITVIVYDANDSSGTTYSSVTVTLNQAMFFTKAFDINLPYTLFSVSGPASVPAPSGNFLTNTTFGPSGAANVTRMGAMQLIINGLQNSSAPDLVIDYVRTNGACNITPNSIGKVIDACGVCGGQATDANQCNTCQIIEATDEVVAFERRLMQQARTLRRRISADRTRARKASCVIDTKIQLKAFRFAFNIVKEAAKKIFIEGVEVCSGSCITISYSEDVEALQPYFEKMEQAAKKLAKDVKRCYAKVRGPYAGSGSGVSGTIQDVRDGLKDLIEDCRDRLVCPH